MGFYVSLIGLFALFILLKIEIDQDRLDNFTDPEKEEKKNFTKYSMNYFYNLNSMFWLISIIYGLLFPTFLSYKLILSGFLTKTHFTYLNDIEKAQKLAGVYVSLITFISIPLLPIFGYLVDRFGHKANGLFISSIIMLVAFIMVYIFHPLVHIFLLGINSAIFGSILRPAIIITLKKSDEVKFLN